MSARNGRSHKKSDADRREEVGKALELRAQGLDFNRIAAELSVSRRTAERRVRDGLNAVIDVRANELRTMAELRLDFLRGECLKVLHNPECTDENRIKAVLAYLKIEERFARLLGLDIPSKVNLYDTGEERESA